MIDTDDAIARLRQFQCDVRNALIRSRTQINLHEVSRDSAADTIYRLDTVVEPMLDAFCDECAKTTPLVLIAEGVEGDGVEGIKVFPEGAREADAKIRLIVDPIDGTRGLMYDKRPAWALAGVAPNRGPATRLRDIEAAVMTELPTSKMGYGDVLWATRGGGTRGERVDLRDGSATPLPLRPSTADTLAHGFASVANFFPGTKALAAGLMEHLVRELLGEADVTKALVFDDQYISTGGQFYELIVGHDRFNADLRPLFYRLQRQPPGLCCHPYDCAAWLIAEETGVVLTDGLGQPLDGPMDVTTGLSWAAYANASLRAKIEPLLTEFFRARGI
jgi:hypothetical protein